MAHEWSFMVQTTRVRVFVDPSRSAAAILENGALVRTCRVPTREPVPVAGDAELIIRSTRIGHLVECFRGGTFVPVVSSPRWRAGLWMLALGMALPFLLGLVSYSVTHHDTGIELALGGWAIRGALLAWNAVMFGLFLRFGSAVWAVVAGSLLACLLGIAWWSSFLGPISWSMLMMFVLFGGATWSAVRVWLAEARLPAHAFDLPADGRPVERAAARTDNPFEGPTA